MGQALGGHGVRAGHHLVPGGQSGGQDGGQQVVGQAVAVPQLIHPSGLGLHRLPQGDAALIGDGGEKPLVFHAGGGGQGL